MYLSPEETETGSIEIEEFLTSAENYSNQTKFSKGTKI